MSGARRLTDRSPPSSVNPPPASHCGMKGAVKGKMRTKSFTV